MDNDFNIEDYEHGSSDTNSDSSDIVNNCLSDAKKKESKIKDGNIKATNSTVTLLLSEIHRVSSK